MVQSYGMEFATSIGVMFRMKEAHNLKTLQETYKFFENSDMDTMIEIIAISYNKQNQTALSIDEMLELLEEKGLGFVAITDIFQDIIERLMYDGLSKEKLEAKKAMVERMNKK